MQKEVFLVEKTAELKSGEKLREVETLKIADVRVLP